MSWTQEVGFLTSKPGDVVVLVLYLAKNEVDHVQDTYRLLDVQDSSQSFPPIH